MASLKDTSCMAAALAATSASDSTFRNGLLSLVNTGILQKIHLSQSFWDYNVGAGPCTIQMYFCGCISVHFETIPTAVDLLRA